MPTGLSPRARIPRSGDASRRMRADTWSMEKRKVSYEQDRALAHGRVADRQRAEAATAER